MSEATSQQPDDAWISLELPLISTPEFQRLLTEHNVSRELVLHLLLLVTQRHYGSTASDQSLREDVEAELKRATGGQDQ